MIVLIRGSFGFVELGMRNEELGIEMARLRRCGAARQVSHFVSLLTARAVRAAATIHS